MNAMTSRVLLYLAGLVLLSATQAQAAYDVTIIATGSSGAQDGSITVSTAVSWATNELTLTAARNIAINANLNGFGTSMHCHVGPGEGFAVTGEVRVQSNASQIRTNQGILPRRARTNDRTVHPNYRAGIPRPA